MAIVIVLKYSRSTTLLAGKCLSINKDSDSKTLGYCENKNGTYVFIENNNSMLIAYVISFFSGDWKANIICLTYDITGYIFVRLMKFICWL